MNGNTRIGHYRGAGNRDLSRDRQRRGNGKIRKLDRQGDRQGRSAGSIGGIAEQCSAHSRVQSQPLQGNSVEGVGSKVRHCGGEGHFRQAGTAGKGPGADGFDGFRQSDPPQGNSFQSAGNRVSHRAADLRYGIKPHIVRVKGTLRNGVYIGIPLIGLHIFILIQLDHVVAVFRPEPGDHIGKGRISAGKKGALHSGGGSRKPCHRQGGNQQHG